MELPGLLRSSFNRGMGLQPNVVTFNTALAASGHNDFAGESRRDMHVGMPRIIQVDHIMTWNSRRFGVSFSSSPEVGRLRSKFGHLFRTLCPQRSLRKSRSCLFAVASMQPELIHLPLLWDLVIRFLCLHGMTETL